MALFDFGKKKQDFADMPPIPGMPPLPPLPPLPEEFGQPPPTGVPPVFQIPGLPEIIPHPGLPPINARIADLQRMGMAPGDINKQLIREGYPATNVLAQAQAQQFAPPPMPPIPQAPPPPPRPVMGPSKEDVVTLLTEDIQEIAEAIIEEKWNKAKKEFADVEKWKDDVDERLKGIEENTEAVKQRMDSIEKAIFGKVEEYGKGIEDVSAELKAMQRVFSTIMPQFTSNIKDLQAMLEKNKKKKKDE